MGDKGGRLYLQNLVSLRWFYNVVDFVFKTLSQSSLLWGTWVTNLVVKLCEKNLVSHSRVSIAFSKRNTSYWTVRVLSLTDFGCRCLNQLWRVTEPDDGPREPLWS